MSKSIYIKINQDWIITRLRVASSANNDDPLPSFQTSNLLIERPGALEKTHHKTLRYSNDSTSRIYDHLLL